MAEKKSKGKPPEKFIKILVRRQTRDKILPLKETLGFTWSDFFEFLANFYEEHRDNARLRTVETSKITDKVSTQRHKYVLATLLQRLEDKIEGEEDTKVLADYIEKLAKINALYNKLGVDKDSELELKVEKFKQEQLMALSNILPNAKKLQFVFKYS